MRRDAAEPAEARGLARDQVRLLVVTGDGVTEAPFRALPEHLAPGDLVVVNTSATVAAAVPGRRGDQDVVVHLARQEHDGSWVAEVRPPGRATGPLPGVTAGDELRVGDLRGVVIATLPGQSRLHRLRLDGDGHTLMSRLGRPVRYAYVPEPWPLSAYQTVFASEPGSAEMPSAGRPFTTELVTRLVCRGVHLAPVLLHTGLSSQEVGEPPQPERFRVPAATAALVNHVRSRGGRVVAVGTTATRALETVAAADGTVEPGEGWTDLVLGPARPARVVGGLVTGWHTDGASHLDLLAAVAGERLVQAAYAEAERRRLLWHELGDSCLLLP